ncbi:MAG TPA: histidine kinase [Nocardioidaceae bacterium]|nr:histidine kinase [Nocardioidaceae bacterium]
MPEEEQRRTLRAVSEDRERIAADLHDRVIQKVFAAGLQLQGMVPELSEDQRRQVAEVMTELDGAIIALRGAIFQLTQPSMPVETERGLRDLAERSRRMLRFTPVVEVRGDLETISRSLHDDLLAVTQEALANIARHANATEATVTLAVEADRVLLEVVDNGDGMPTELSRTSGTENILRRARDLGGDAAWHPGEPRGTRLVWSAPLG